MPYTSNPYAPKARKIAIITLKKEGLTCSEMARRMGVHRSTIGRWLARDTHHYLIPIETKPSRPKFHPRTLDPSVVKRIVELRIELKRSAPVLHEHLITEGVVVSLSSVERTLRRLKLTRKKKQASYYQPISRPKAEKPGDLVHVDTIHFIKPNQRRFYIYAVIDLYSRYAGAWYSPKIGQKISLKVVREAQKRFGFKFKTVQTDNGPEFKDGFAIELARRYIKVRHSRVRRPNDNAHVERFVRTLQEEALDGRIPSERGLQRRLDTYLDYYNNLRLHFGLQLQTPTEFVAKVSS
jgi:transposase InsO family protein